MEPDHERRPGPVARVLRFLGLRRGPDPPPDAAVREPRRPRPPATGGVATLEPPETEERT